MSYISGVLPITVQYPHNGITRRWRSISTVTFAFQTTTTDHALDTTHSQGYLEVQYFWSQGRSLVFLQVRGTLTLYNNPCQKEPPKNRNHTLSRHPRGADTCHVWATYLTHMTEVVFAFILILTCCLSVCQPAPPLTQLIIGCFVKIIAHRIRGACSGAEHLKNSHETGRSY